LDKSGGNLFDEKSTDFTAQPDPEYVKSHPVENKQAGEKSTKKSPDANTKPGNQRKNDKTGNAKSIIEVKPDETALNYKWKILQKNDKTYYFKNLPGGVVKKFEMLSDASR
jgi:hypothetical protein